MSNHKKSQKPQITKTTTLLNHLPKIVELSDEQVAMIVGGEGTSNFIREGLNQNHNEIMVDIAELLN